MLKIRLQRVGRKHDPVFRVVVAEHTTGPKSGKFVEKLGWYDARHGKREFNGERITYWMEKGAQVSPTMHNFLVDEKIISGTKINVLPKKKTQPEASKTGEEKPSEEKKEEGPKEASEAKEEAEAKTGTSQEETKEAGPEVQDETPTDNVVDSPRKASKEDPGGKTEKKVK
jgi:small subunit ribosomal protein S16